MRNFPNGSLLREANVDHPSLGFPESWPRTGWPLPGVAALRFAATSLQCPQVRGIYLIYLIYSSLRRCRHGRRGRCEDRDRAAGLPASWLCQSYGMDSDHLRQCCHRRR
eukprot:scaffold268_cov236-Pinguiococcus_pyrenoidosus.AAC.20